MISLILDTCVEGITAPVLKIDKVFLLIISWMCTENTSSTNIGNSTVTVIVEDLKQSMENEDSCNQENICPNLLQFRDFYYNVQKLLLKENTVPKKNQVYQEFIRKNNFDENDNYDLGTEDDSVEKPGLQDEKCQSSFTIQCQKLVSDFMFLDMVKVHWCLTKINVTCI